MACKGLQIRSPNLCINVPPLPSPAVECGRLPNPPSGQVSLTGIDLGSVATYTCNDGYSLEEGGDATRTCGSEGVWSGREPTCRSKSTMQVCNHAGINE